MSTRHTTDKWGTPVTQHRAVVTHIDETTVRGGRSRWDIWLDCGAHDHELGARHVVASTLDQFAAETLLHAKASGQTVDVGLGLSPFGYELMSCEVMP